MSKPADYDDADNSRGEAEQAAELEANDDSKPPQPLPAPGALDEFSPPPPVPRYSRFELRQLRSELLDSESEGTHCWTPIPAESTHVRAASYLKDGKKAPSSYGSLLLAVELFRASSAKYHVASRADSPAETLPLRTTSPVGSVFVVNLILPAAEGVYQLVLYFGILEEKTPSSASRLLARFAAGSDAFRNARLKLIPTLQEGPWIVQKAVSSRPAILGKALRQRFFRTDSYMEVDVDCNSSPAAGRIVSLVKSYARSLVVDLSFVIEAQTTDELPERVLGCGRLMRIALEDSTVPSIDAGEAA